jgi:adenylate cyclase
LSAFLIHLVAYVAVCGFLVATWALTSGSFEEVGRIAEHPSLVSKLGFWPIWVILGWAVAIVIHLTVVAVQIPERFFSPRARRDRKRRRRDRNRRRRREREQRPRVEDAARIGAEAVDRAIAAIQQFASKRRSAAPDEQTATEKTVPVRRWVTVMFTDIANSTTLNEMLGDERWHEILARYRDLVRAAFAARSGEEVGTQGDGFLGKFPTPAEAVLCGVDIQRDVGDIHQQADLDLKVRIGIHSGEAVEEEGDVVGRVVNLAARVTSEADPGEILVTEPVADYLGTRLQFEDRGLRPLKGVPQARHLLAVVWNAGDR